MARKSLCEVHHLIYKHTCMNPNRLLKIKSDVSKELGEEKEDKQQDASLHRG